MSKTMKFTFEKLILFRRIFDFNNPWSARNDYWLKEDSDSKFIKQFKCDTRQTLVKNLEISSFFRGDRLDTETYLVTLTGVTGSKDVFYVSIKLLSNFLKEFDLL